MTDSFPPPGYIQTESAVEGIEVFQPAPEKEERQEVVDFFCPQCGATVAYSAKEGGLKCTSCGYYEPPRREIVGKGAEEFEFKVETLELAAHGWGEHRKQLECQSCYAVTTLPPGQLTYSCPFCGSSKVIQGDAAQDALRPRFLIPFKLNAEDCYPVTDKWLGKSWMTPGKLRHMARLGQFTGIYLPFWTFDARTGAQWRAEVGYNKTETYYVNGERKTRTVTHWRWESGSVSLNFDDLLVSGTSHISEAILAYIADFDLDKLAPYEPAYLAGWQAQAYDVPLEQAWETGRSRMRGQTRDACKRDALSGGGDKIRNLSMELAYSDETWRYVLLPVYLATYTYNEQIYQIIINGLTGSIGGSRPVDWLKVWLVIIALYIPGAFSGLIGLALPPVIILAGVLLIAALVGTFVIISSAMKLQDPERSGLFGARR